MIIININLINLKTNLFLFFCLYREKMGEIPRPQELGGAAEEGVGEGAAGVEGAAEVEVEGGRAHPPRREEAECRRLRLRRRRGRGRKRWASIASSRPSVKGTSPRSSSPSTFPPYSW